MDLAQQASQLPTGVQLGGWLHRHTCFVSSKLIREEKRRQNRETEAAGNPRQSTTDATFNEIVPLLDNAIEELPEDDRSAIVMRFFERRDFRSARQLLETTEDAARMRVSRAVDKLRAILMSRGATASAVALAAILSSKA